MKRRKYFCESDREKGLILRQSFYCRPVAQSLDGYERKATPPNSSRKQRQPHCHALRNADTRRQRNEDEVQRKQQPAAEIAPREAQTGNAIALIFCRDVRQKRIVENDARAKAYVCEDEESRTQKVASGCQKDQQTSRR